MEIIVRVNDDLQTVTVEMDELTSSVAEKIANANEIQAEGLLLVFEGSVLENDKAVMSYGVTSDSELVVEFSEAALSAAKLRKLGVKPTVENLLEAFSNSIDLIPDLINTVPDLNVCFGGDYAITKACATQKDWVIKLLLKRGINVNPRYSAKENRFQKQGNPLFIAAVHARLPIVKLLVGAGAELENKIGNRQVTPLMGACFVRGNLPVVKFLVENGAKVNITTKDDVTPLMNALQRDTSIAEYLLGAIPDLNINQISADGDTALGISAHREDIYFVRKLLSMGATPNGTKRHPLVKALRQNNEAIVSLFLGYDIPVEETLSAASKYCSLDVFNLVFGELRRRIGDRDLKAKINQIYDDNSTPLQSCLRASSRDTRIAAVLLDAGADPNIFHRHSEPALHLACKKGTETVKMLLDHGADANICNSRNQTAVEANALFHPITLLVERIQSKEALQRCLFNNCCRDVVFTRALLDRGADPNNDVRNSFRTPFMMYAAATDVLKYAIECGGDINKRTTKSVTPLHVACHARRPDNVKLLLQLGADRHVPDTSGRTAADYASGECAELLGRNVTVHPEHRLPGIYSLQY